MPNRADHTLDFVQNLTNHQAALRAFIVSQMPGVPGVGDVLQEVNLLLWEKKAKFETGTNFKAWSFAIARYKLMEHRRRLKRDGWLVFDNEVAESLMEEISDDAQRSELYAQALELCVSRLPFSDRELILRRYSSDTTLKGYAEKIGKEPGALRTALFRVRGVLRDCVDSNISGGNSQLST